MFTNKHLWGIRWWPCGHKKQTWWGSAQLLWSSRHVCMALVKREI